MMGKKQFTNFLLLLSLLWVNKSGAEKFVCPSPEKIFPCVCSVDDNNFPLGNLNCSGMSISQESIDKLFSEIKIVNKISHQDALFDISAFYLESPQMTQLNVAPLVPLNFGILSLNFLNEVKQIVTTREQALIGGAKNIFLQSSWTDHTLVQLLQNIQPESIRTLELGSNKIRLSTEEVRRTISNLTRLEHLNLNGNQIPKIVTSSNVSVANKSKAPAVPLKLSWSLSSLNLSRCNLIELGQNVFLFEDKRDPHDFDWALTIDLSNNLLTHDFIHPNSGLTAIRRPTSLSLENNFLEFLSADKFKRFLDATPWNSLSVHGNPFVCDERMLWLVKGRDMYEGRVEGVKCSNDPEGKNIFETTLV